MRPHFVFCSQAFRYCEDGFSPSLQLPNLTCIVAPVSDLLPRLVGEGIADEIQAAATLDPGLTSRVCCRQRHSWRLCRRILKAEAAFRWRWPPVTSRHLLSPERAVVVSPSPALRGCPVTGDDPDRGTNACVLAPAWSMHLPATPRIGPAARRRAS
jgi:hypothetical protein